MIIPPTPMPTPTHRNGPLYPLANVVTLASLGLVPLLATPAPRAARADEPEAPATLPPAAGRPVDYARDIASILSRNCYRCHGPKKQQAGLALHQEERAMA